MIPFPDIEKTVFTVSDYLSWQRQGTLRLNPPFQRRSVWKPGAKSYLIDTIVRGLPTPLLFLRDQIDLEHLSHVREVIDGQQRLRTVLAFLDPKSLDDFDPETDGFTVRREHNSMIAGKAFGQLSAEVRERILAYKFSTHVLPTATEDRDVLTIFARLNSTGTALNPQELRNAEFFGAFKSTVYELAYEQLERWIAWRIFDSDSVARMQEVELTSDVLGNMVDGLAGKSQPKLRALYKKYDDKFPTRTEASRRFREVFDAIDSLLGARMGSTVYRSPVHFFTLHTYLYELMYGLGSALDNRKARRLPSNLSPNPPILSG